MLFVLKRIIRSSQARLELLRQKYNFSKEFMHKTLSKKFRAGSRPEFFPARIPRPEFSKFRAGKNPGGNSVREKKNMNKLTQSFPSWWTLN